MRYLAIGLMLMCAACAIARRPLMSPTGRPWPQASDLQSKIPNVPR